MKKTLAFFDPDTGSVYPIKVYKTVPETALPIPDSIYNQFLSAKIDGFKIDDGKVVSA